MTVKALRQMLSPDDDDKTVLVLVRVPDDNLDAPYLWIAGVRKGLDPDTADEIVILECDVQEF